MKTHGHSASQSMASRCVTTTRLSRIQLVSAQRLTSKDFETIQKKLELGFGQSERGYQAVAEFSQDIMRVFENARLYNQPDTIYYKYAN